MLQDRNKNETLLSDGLAVYIGQMSDPYLFIYARNTSANIRPFTKAEDGNRWEQSDVRVRQRQTRLEIYFTTFIIHTGTVFLITRKIKTARVRDSNDFTLARNEYSKRSNYPIVN